MKQHDVNYKSSVKVVIQSIKRIGCFDTLMAVKPAVFIPCSSVTSVSYLTI